MAVAPSEEAVSTMVEPPSEPVQPVVPTEPEPVEPTVTPEPTLVELPDGRKVTPEVVVQEYKNLLTDYTKKSQTLAEIEKSKTINQALDNPLADPTYQPQSYDELAQQIEARAEAKKQAAERAALEEQQAKVTATISQLDEVLALDPALKGREATLFTHATKYGFKDLKLAHQNMKDMADMAKKVQATTAANIAKRNDPVSTTQGASGVKLDRANYGSARNYYQALPK